MAHIWIVDDDSALRFVLEKTFSQEGYTVTSFDDAQKALTTLQNITLDTLEQTPNVILSDIRMPNMDGLTFLDELKQSHGPIPVIIMTAHSDLQSAVSSYETGAFEYLPKPFDLDEAITLVKRALDQSAKHKNITINTPVNHPQNQSGIIGESAAMQEVFRAIGRLAHSNITVLINGESGTGKELIAQALHKHSPRKKNSFIALNMAAIPHDLIEAELFGHEKGAFTGANSTRKGRFEQANGGTLFLDEIGDMPFATQTRLLRVLADGEFYRVGGHTPVKVDVRIVAATHQNLEKLVQEGKFREDLFYRLNVIRIQLPALRERPEDIPMLTEHFLQLAAKEMAVERKQMNPQAQKIMQTFTWRGNVRQLENTCRWLMVMASGREILPEDLPEEMLQVQQTQFTDTMYKPTQSPQQTSQTANVAQVQPKQPSEVQTDGLTYPPLTWQQSLATWVDNALSQGQHDILASVQPEFEKCLIEVALKHTKGRKGEASQLLGWGRNTLTRKLQDLAIE